MIQIENTEIAGWMPAMRGMRNPMNSWDKADSKIKVPYTPNDFVMGPEDHDLAMRLRKAGTDHRKFIRMVICWVDITAPLYWWKEFDTYRNGVEKNSCSTMHKIASKEFTLNDFSCEHMTPCGLAALGTAIERLNMARGYYNRKIDKLEEGMNWKDYWWDMIQLLPSSYNQRRTVMMSYEALANMYHARKHHKLDEWREFCRWVESLPYAELITGEENTNE